MTEKRTLSKFSWNFSTTRMHSSRMRTTPLIDRISSYPMHKPPPKTMHAPQIKPCMPPRKNHAHPRKKPRMSPPEQPCTPPQSNHACPPKQPCMPPQSNHACPPEQPHMPPRATTHAPQATTHAPLKQPRTPPLDRMTDTCKNITFANYVCGR